MKNKQIRIFQMLPHLYYGDGVGNDALAIDRIIKELGYPTQIYADEIDRRIAKGLAETAEKMPEIQANDVIIYHLSTGADMNKRVENLAGRKIMIYHNITPAFYFKNYSLASMEACENGRNDLDKLSDKVEYCLADSEYNKLELMAHNYTCKVDVLPILIPFEDYEKEPDKDIISKYKDGWTNIIFVGRIAPNKKQEDIIKTFYYYKKYVNPKSRLFLVGSYKGMERYYQKLMKYVQELQIEDVNFTGHTRFEEILAYYRIADVFVCMSEHEGFCIPLIEAMYFDVPIVAYACTGVEGTLAGAGLTMKEKDCMVAAEMIRMLTENEELRDKVLKGQKKRLQDFAYEKTRQQFIGYLKGFVE